MRTSNLSTPGLLGLLLLLPALGGCGREGALDVPVTVRDSAGIRIIETLALPRGEEQGWEVSLEPSASIHAGVGGEGRVVGGGILADGRIVLARRGSDELLFFGREGALQRRLKLPVLGSHRPASLSFLGLSGSGALVGFDEIHRIILLLRPGEADFSARRVSGYGSSILAPVGMLGERALVFTERVSEGEGGGELGLARSSVRIVSVGVDGRVAEVLAERPGMEIWRSKVDGSVVGRALPFGDRLLIAVGEDRIFLSHGDQYEVEALDSRGRSVRLIRLTRDPLPVREEDVRRRIEELLDRITWSPEARSGLREEYGSMPRPRRMPPFRSLVVDRLGFLWAEDYRRPGDSVPVWTVFDPEGRGVARLTLPAELELLDVGADYLLALHTGAGGRETVRLYGLSRS